MFSLYETPLIELVVDEDTISEIMWKYHNSWKTALPLINLGPFKDASDSELPDEVMNDIKSVYAMRDVASITYSDVGLPDYGVLCKVIELKPLDWEHSSIFQRIRLKDKYSDDYTLSELLTEFYHDSILFYDNFIFIGENVDLTSRFNGRNNYLDIINGIYELTSVPLDKTHRLIREPVTIRGDSKLQEYLNEEVYTFLSENLQDHAYNILKVNATATSLKLYPELDHVDVIIDYMDRILDRRYTGILYYTHVIEITAILDKANVDLTSDDLAGIALHDVVEDTDVGIDEIRLKFGEGVSSIVEQMTDKTQELAGEVNRAKRKEMERVRYANEVEPKVQTFKLADILTNVLSVIVHDPKFAKTYVPECYELAKVLTEADKGLRSEVISAIEKYGAEYL